MKEMKEMIDDIYISIKLGIGLTKQKYRIDELHPPFRQIALLAAGHIFLAQNLELSIEVLNFQNLAEQSPLNF